MRLLQHTDYAMRVLMYAAPLWGDGRLASIREIAEAHAISENHLMKVVHRLGQLKLLHTVRGRNGGLRLSRPPGEIRVGTVIRLLEQDSILVECFDSKSGCRLQGRCGLARVIAEAHEAFFVALDRYTLADVLPRGAPVKFKGWPDDRGRLVSAPTSRKGSAT